MGQVDPNHGFPHPFGFARYLADAARQRYGALIREFLRLLTANKSLAVEMVTGLHRLPVSSLSRPWL